MVLLPNGISAFRFADGGQYDLDAMVLAAEAIRPFPCPAGAGQTSPAARQPLSANELRTEFPGHTFYADGAHRFPLHYVGPLNLYLAAGGVLYGRSIDDFNVSTWHITPEGELCCK